MDDVQKEIEQIKKDIVELKRNFVYYHTRHKQRALGLAHLKEKMEGCIRDIEMRLIPAFEKVFPEQAKFRRKIDSVVDQHRKSPGAPDGKDVDR